ncbi:MAG: anti-sigma regulatory factor [Gemmatimonadetes bacterium]|nr:MAG: anti-sigma regulatory factor [Gemmatimonadota bacterium]
MSVTQTETVRVTSEPDIVTARQKARQVAKQIGFSMVNQIKIATGVSELARNIIKYGGSDGQVEISVREENGKKGILIVCSDQGPGIEDIDQAMQDGYTTAGGLGAGLPGTKRLMDEFKVESTVGEGTTVTCCKWL